MAGPSHHLLFHTKSNPSGRHTVCLRTEEAAAGGPVQKTWDGRINTSVIFLTSEYVCIMVRFTVRLPLALSVDHRAWSSTTWLGMKPPAPVTRTLLFSITVTLHMLLLNPYEIIQFYYPHQSPIVLAPAPVVPQLYQMPLTL